MAGVERENSTSRGFKFRIDARIFVKYPGSLGIFRLGIEGFFFPRNFFFVFFFF